MKDLSSSEHLVIEADGIDKAYYKDLFRHRELFYFLAWRDILVRYKQAAFGVAWAIIRPLLNMALFTLIFNKIAHLSSFDVPYPLFVLAGMLPWQLVSGAITDTSMSLLNNVSLLTKIYFPRMILATSQIFVHLVDFGINFILLSLLMLLMGVGNLSTLWMLPFFLALSLFLSIALSLSLSALTAKYRDFRFIVAFAVQFGMFASPIGYGTYIIEGAWKWLYFMNPMVGIIDGFRWALFGIEHESIAWSILFSCIITTALLYTGIKYFRSTEKSFADRI